jgi:hypothetical protein
MRLKSARLQLFITFIIDPKAPMAAGDTQP